MIKLFNKKTSTKSDGPLIIGHIDSFNGYNLKGWVAYENKSEPVELCIIKQGKVIAEVKAEKFRQDLFEAGIGSGKHGFDIDLSFGQLTSDQDISFIEKKSRKEFKLNNQDKIRSYYNLTKLEEKNLNLLEHLSFFDCSYYTSKGGQDITEFNLNPYRHYLTRGFEENREFSEYSHTKYLKSCLDSFNDKFSYFLNNYENLDFSISPFFDTFFYKQQLTEKGIQCNTEYFSHYISEGYKSGLMPSAFFDPVLLKRAKFPFGKQEVISWVIKLYRNNAPENCPDVSRFYNESAYEEVYETRLHGWKTGIEHYFKDGILSKHTSPHPLFFNEIYSNTIGHHTQLAGVVYLSRYLQLPKPKNMLTSGVADLSVVILNWNKSLLTLQCVTTVMATMQNSNLTYEVVIVDNGSNSKDYFTLVESLGNKCRVIRNAENKYYGEANNIGVESTIGKKVLFLNNDAFVTEDTIKEMMSIINNEDVGAVGSKLLFPDGTLQEAGGKISACGQVTQIGKGLENHDGMYSEIREVDYCSAACLLMDKQFFLDIGGFDYLYEPAYFEDTDLCTKVKLHGKKVLFQANAITYHVENLTSRDPVLNFRFFENIKTNRNKFVNRWHNFLEGIESQEHTLSVLSLKPFVYPASRLDKGNRKKALLYSPYALTQGGGERYILTFATVLNSMGYDTHFATPDNLSKTRLRNLGRDLGIDLDNIKPISWKVALSISVFEIQVCMGNEVIPPVPGIAKYNIYHCQFPFDMTADLVANNQIYLASYHMVIVNSKFTQENYQKQLAKIQAAPVEVKVVYPPCPLIGITENQIINKKPWILNVGRFFTGGHQKKQHVAIEAFKTLIDQNPDLINKGVQLHLAGSMGALQEHKDYFDSLLKQSEGYPVKFHVNISDSNIKQLYKSSQVYWHFTGWGEDIEHNPEFFEHFGISTVEAISAGVIPVLPNFAGPSQTLEMINQPSAYSNIEEILDATKDIITRRKDNIFQQQLLILKDKASLFSTEQFMKTVQEIITNMLGVK